MASSGVKEGGIRKSGNEKEDLFAVEDPVGRGD